MSDELPLMELRANRAASILYERVRVLVSGNQINRAMVAIVEKAVSDHRIEAILAGISFPTLVVLPLPAQGAVQLVRADLDEKGIQTIVLNLTVQYPEVTAGELAAAVRHGFPDFRTGNLQLEKHEARAN
jgi:hypothetical protein